MIKRSILQALAVSALLLAGTPVEAGTAARAWVSGHGTDQASCGAVQSPCRTLQYAHDTIVGANSEIDILDSAGYGSLAINKSVNVVSDGNLAGVLAPSGGIAITINAGLNDTVVLRGLTIEGANVGIHGVVLLGGAKLVISDCTVQNFTQEGIFLQPNAGATKTSITRTRVSNNGDTGILFFGQSSAGLANIDIDGVTATHNTAGIGVNNYFGSATVIIGISNSVISNNSSAGLSFTGANSGGAVKISIDTTVSRSNSDGIKLGNSATLYLGRSVIWGNTIGVNGTGSAAAFSYKDNRIDGNGTALTVPLTSATPQ